MNLFRRRDANGANPAPAPGQRTEEHDWRVYDDVAEAYARVQAPRTALAARDLVAMTVVGEGERVLDVGTGTGVVARAAAEAAGADGLVVGVDRSLQMLGQARQERGRGRFAAAEAIDLPFRDAMFDVVLLGFTVTHFRKYETALFDVLRVLRPGGRFGTATWGQTEDEFVRAWNEVAEQLVGRELLRDAYRRAQPWSERFSDRRRAKDTLYEVGVRELQVERREYRFEMTAEEYLVAREISTVGRFLHDMLGERLWDRFRARAREVFADRFPPAFNDFRDVILATGVKPGS